jgi:hypothetical protein
MTLSDFLLQTFSFEFLDGDSCEETGNRSLSLTPVFRNDSVFGDCLSKVFNLNLPHFMLLFAGRDKKDEEATTRIVNYCRTNYCHDCPSLSSSSFPLLGLSNHHSYFISSLSRSYQTLREET